MPKVLFLDIDGVLNSNYWNKTHQKEISDGTLLDEEKIKIFASLIHKTNAKIILSWLQSHDDATGWAVLDDLDLHNAKIEQHQVKPDPAIGLTLEDIEKAEKILLNER